MDTERLLRMIALAEVGKLNTEIGEIVGLKRARVSQIFHEAGRDDLCGYARRSASGCHRPPYSRSQRTPLSERVVRAALDYDHLTGEFRWRHRHDMPSRWNVRHAGKKAGGVNSKHGYYEIRLNGVLYTGHVLAWIHFHGRLKKGLVIDHRDGNRSNNRIENLRMVTQKVNLENTTVRRQTHGLPPPHANRQ